MIRFPLKVLTLENVTRFDASQSVARIVNIQSDHSAGTRARRFWTIKTLATATVAAIGLGLFLAWTNWRFHQKVAPGNTLVDRAKIAGRTLVTAERTIGVEMMHVVGSVRPRRKTEVASQLLASIREIRVRPGDRVHAGDVLVILDDRELVAQRREAVAALAAAEADLVTRRADYERIRVLRNTGAVTIEEVSRMEGGFKVAETQVRRAQESISRIEVQITYTKIAVSTGGLVSERFAEPGDLASPGKPILAVYDPNDLELQVNVPESLAVGITIGQLLDIRIDANGLATSARVREVVPQAQATTRSVLVKLGLPQTNSNPIIPGMFGRAAIPIGHVERIWLPMAAIQRIGQLELVDVAGADELLTRRFVRLGREANDQVEVLAGLAPGERVALPVRRPSHQERQP